jgi:hypothetical protein
MTEEFQLLKCFPTDLLTREKKSARGLAHSKTLRVVFDAPEFAAASWTAVALHRFSLST